MSNKKFWSGMLIMALVFGTAVIGCDTGTNAGSNTGSAGPVEPDDITYEVTANGALDTKTSTELTFTFSEAVDLISSNIRITNVTGKAAADTSKKDNLKGGDTSWTLIITGVTAGKIRVQIDKDGIERGRKTVLVHQYTASALTKEDAIPLTAGQWEDGSIVYGDAKWYKFETEAGKEYRVQWKNQNDQPVGADYTAYSKIIAYQSDGTTTINGSFNDSGYWDSPLTQGGSYWSPYYAYSPQWKNLISGQSGTVYLKVEVSSSEFEGTFAVRFYDTANMPKVNVSFFSAMATPVPSVSIKWCVVPLSDSITTSEVTGFRVYRSDTQTGTYTQIGEDFMPGTGFNLVGYDASNDADRVIYYDNKDLTVGKTYWYKVIAFNKSGETDFSDPIESEKVPGPIATPLTIGAAAVEGTLPAPLGTVMYGTDLPYPIPPEANWYTFTAEAGKTYKVQWESYEDGDSDKSKYGCVAVCVFTADKECIDFITPYSTRRYNGVSKGYTTPGTVSGVSGPVYIRVNLYIQINSYGPGRWYTAGDPSYTIRVYKE